MPNTKCQCLLCSWCNGSGFNYELFGEVTRNHPCDDLADIVPCDECHGSRLAEVCDNCRDYDDDARDRVDIPGLEY